MNNLTRILSVIVLFTLITACGGESTTETEAAIVPVPTPAPAPAPTPAPAPAPKSFDITFNKTNFEVQFNQSLTIPFDLTKDKGHSVEKSLSIPPTLGEVTINDNSFEYTPSGAFGEDTLTVSITDNKKTVEQEITIVVSDRTPHLVLSDPIYGLSTELEDGVTVWGYNLGDQQNNSTIELCNLSELCLAMPSIIHWKNTDANLPSILADLSTSQKIQEVKFSLPETSEGDKYILITTQFGNTTLPFTVRPKTFEVIFDEVHYEVQFDQDITIPLDITLDEGHSVITTLSALPSLGEATIIGDTIKYIPSGSLGEDRLTISITDNKKTVEQEITVVVSDRTPQLVLSDPIYGLSTELEDGVTVWGYNLGDQQNDSTIELCDLSELCLAMPSIIHWKNTDANLPSILADLSSSQIIQEVKFSLPETSTGEKLIRISNKFGITTLPFTVRAKIFEVVFDETNYEVQFNQDILIPFYITLDEGHSVITTLSALPSLGEATIIDNTIKYIPSGSLGEDRLTISITDNKKTVEQELVFLVSDRTPQLVLSDPIYGLSTELEDGVTVWGYNLGDQQNDSTIELCDLVGQCLAMPNIIHWKNTQENLPNTLTDLSASQIIQEVKFYIPETSEGDKYILITTQFGITTLPFTVRPKTFEVVFNETNYEVQFDQDITIPFYITLDEGHSVITSLSVLPSLGQATIVGNTIKYIPSGTIGKDRLTISITDNKKTVEQELVFLVSDRSPHLAFSDLISGPSTGLGDGKGSGVIVTVWGFKLDDSQNGSTIELCDLNNVCSEAAYVYYWKNADGQLPSGPANLYESHGMQEIAFSIPNHESGPCTIRLSNDLGYSELPFTVREGNIYHVKTTGSDTAGDGSFDNPWLTVSKGDSGAGAGAGDTLYIHDVATTSVGSTSTDRYAYYLNQGFKATEVNQFAYVSYPNTRATLHGMVGVGMYLTTGIVSSKLSVFTSNCADETLVGCTETGTNGIAPSAWGRVVGNAITDREGMCASGQAGAISGGVDEIEGAMILGNYIYDYGCPNTGKLHHTTYITIRGGNDDPTLVPPVMAWNYLKDNLAKNGIHYYDENKGNGTECGTWSGDILIHDNVVVNQGGAGIAYASACSWDNDVQIYNNVLINTGLPVDVDCTLGCGSPASAIVIIDGEDGGIQGDVYVYNNTIHTWNSQNQAGTLQSCMVLRGYGDTAQVYFNDNVCYSDFDRPFLTAFSFSASINHDDNLHVSNNSWFTSFVNPTLAIVPTSDTAPIIADPLLTLSGAQIKLSEASRLKAKSSVDIKYGIYGTIRNKTSNVGAIQK
jgi:hypothetical protein